MANTTHSLQHLVNFLPQYTADDYSELLRLRGARAVFNTPVRRRSGQSLLDDEGQVGCFLLKKSALSEELQQVVDNLKLWAEGGKFCLWVSPTLPADLNLPWKIVTPQCVISTIVFLGVDRHFFVLTLYDDDPQPLAAETSKASSRQTDEAQAEGNSSREACRDYCKQTDEVQAERNSSHEACRDYCKQIAKALTLSLYYFCPSDFCLLPCTLQLSQFSVENLQRELQQQMDHLSLVYGGPRRVNAALYAKLKVAVTAVAGVTYVPCFYENPECSKFERRLVLMEGDWRDVLSLMIESVYQKSGRTVEYTTYNERSVKVALLEAALRLSVHASVIIVTPDDKIRATASGVVHQAKEFEDQILHLQVLSSDEQTLPTADYVISIDCETQIPCTPSFSAIKGDERQLLLFFEGQTGSGRSATGNILVGKSDAFTVTNQYHREQSKDDGRSVEVVDTPGLYDTDKEHSAIFQQYLTAVVDICQDFHAVLYVVRIGDFSEFGAYRRLKRVLGDVVVNHLILVFTHGDELGETSIQKMLETAPKELKTVLNECKNRFVVFDNTAENKGPQVSRLLNMVRELRAKNRGVAFAYQGTVPSMETFQTIPHQMLEYDIRVRQLDRSTSLDDIFTEKPIAGRGVGGRGTLPSAQKPSGRRRRPFIYWFHRLCSSLLGETIPFLCSLFVLWLLPF